MSAAGALASAARRQRGRRRGAGRRGGGRRRGADRRARGARAHPEHHRARGRDRGRARGPARGGRASRWRCSTRTRRRSATTRRGRARRCRARRCRSSSGGSGRAGRAADRAQRPPRRRADRAIPATWTADPFGGEIRDGDAVRPRRERHEGRRRGDPRRAAGARGERASCARLDGELIVALVPSEEDGGQGTLAAIRAGATGDLAIIPEPSLLDIVVAHAGAITFRLEVPGRAAHASKRREGVSALANLQVLDRGARGGRGAPERGGDRSADDRARPALPDDRRHGRGRGVGVDGHGPGRRGGPLRRAARPVARGRVRRAACGGRCRVRRGRLPARPSPDARAHRRPVRRRRACRRTIRCRRRSPTSPRP